MADKKISALTGAATPLDGTEVLPIVQSGATVKVANNDLRPKQIQSNATSGVLQVAGPAAAATRVMTTPDANFTVARTDAAQSFTGNQTFDTDTLFVDASNKRVGVGTASPTKELNVIVPATAGRQNLDAVSRTSQNLLTVTNPEYSTDASMGIMFRSFPQSDARQGAGIFASGGSGNNVTDLNLFVSGLGGADTTYSAVYIEGTAGDVTVRKGNLLVGTTNNASSARIMCNGGLAVQTNGNGNRSMLVNLVSNENFNGAATTIYVGRDGTTSRSINAGGTVNASGADYAEYMTKSGNFTVAKGDVVGIDAQGKLTNVFANAISFVVKSTDPSYVGGDTWGTEEAIGLKRPIVPVRALDETEQRLVSEATEDQEAVYETIVTKAGDSDEEWATKEAAYLAEKAVFDAALESARAVVDRVAFAGQVPVNVLGATAGQYIVPVDDNGSIKGQAVSNPTFEQYQSAVGKVIAIESDGRARIIVKVA